MSEWAKYGNVVVIPHSFSVEVFALKIKNIFATILSIQGHFSITLAELYLVPEQTHLYSFRTWLLGDHLGSTSMVTDDTGDIVSEVRYSAFGEVRYESGTMTTDYLYTGQRQESEVGLYYYVARWYDPAIGRFVQADSVVPNPGSARGV